MIGSQKQSKDFFVKLKTNLTLAAHILIFRSATNSTAERKEYLANILHLLVGG